MEAFVLLSPSRAIGLNSVGHIPLTEIAAYFEIFNISDLEDRHEHLTLIRALDAEYVSFHNEKQK